MTEDRIGFVTQTHTGVVSPLESIEWAGEIGFDFVELYLDGASERTRLDTDGLVEAMEDRGLDAMVHLPFVDLDLGSPRDRIRKGSIEELETCLDVAETLGAEKAVLHASSHASPPEWAHETVKPRILESVRELDAYGADRGVEICVENLPGTVYSIREIDEVLSETSASLTLDTGHARVDGFDAERTASFLEDHRDRVSTVHINDAREARDEHVPVGSGTTDFERILRPIADDWEGTLSIETYTFDRDYLALSKEKLEAAL